MQYAAIIDQDINTLFLLKESLHLRFPDYEIDCYQNENQFIENTKGYQLIFIDGKTCHFFILSHIHNHYPDSHIVFISDDYYILPYDDISTYSLEVRYRGKHMYIETSDIYYIECYYHNLSIYDRCNQYNGIYTTLQYYENNLNKSMFIKINQSILVNIHHILECHDDHIVLDNGTVLFPSCRYKKEVIQKVKKNIA